MRFQVTIEGPSIRWVYEVLVEDEPDACAKCGHVDALATEEQRVGVLGAATQLGFGMLDAKFSKDCFQRGG